MASYFWFYFVGIRTGKGLPAGKQGSGKRGFPVAEAVETAGFQKILPGKILFDYPPSPQIFKKGFRPKNDDLVVIFLFCRTLRWVQAKFHISSN